MFLGGADGSDFLEDMHAAQGCRGCHGGAAGEVTKDEAHVGLNPDPSMGATNSCSNAQCHSNIDTENSVHTTQAGYIKMIEKRAGIVFEDHPDVVAGFEQSCASCHATCGSCHISQPKSVGGGLIKEHKINRRPDMTRNCTACHGSRVGDEFRGSNEYAGADVHYRPGAMTCMACHGAAEMHGDGSRPEYRYEVANMPRCNDSGCHAGLENANMYHTVHMDDMSCQVCHSQNYKSCNGCHVGEGITGSSYETFKIGLNPIPELRDHKYALLRHIPVSPDTYEAWGIETLASFDDEPTWKYATPHNIRLRTDRTPETTGGENCFDACHNSTDWFLRDSDLTDVDRDANVHLTVPDGSPPWSN